MSTVTHWFTCSCGRSFVEHHPQGGAADGRCPSCGGKAERRTISEAAAAIAAVTDKDRTEAKPKRRA